MAEIFAGPVALIGYMGSGKTTVGRILSRRLRRRFIDLDREVSLAARRSIPEIFAESGEPGFRKLEHETLVRVIDDGEAIIACGGGIVTYPPSRECLRDVKTIFLEEDVEVLYDRTRKPGRPLRGATRKDFESRYADRLPLYRETADFTVLSASREPEEVVEEILRWAETW